MDSATIIGFIGGVFIVALAVVLSGNPITFINVPAILIVIIGTLFVVTMKFSLVKMRSAFGLAMKAFFFKVDEPSEVIEQVIGLSRLLRKEGPLALAEVQIHNNYLARGVDMIVDGTDVDLCRSILLREMAQSSQRHEEGRRIFRAISDVAPAMGMIGTLIGLVEMLSNMADPNLVGPAMAIALLTTLYGAILANMVAKPIADKLEMRSKEEELLRSIVCDAVTGMAQGHSPYILEQTLVSYLPTSIRNDNDVDGSRHSSGEPQRVSPRAAV